MSTQEPERVPVAVASELANARIPHQLLGGRFTRNPELQPFKVEGRQFVCFGRAGAFGLMCVDVGTGEVVAVHGVKLFRSLAAGAPADLDGSRIAHANASIDGFVRCIEAVLALYPFYRRDTAGEEVDAIARSVGEALDAADPTSMMPDSFWCEFRWDLTLGDFSVEDLGETGVSWK